MSAHTPGPWLQAGCSVYSLIQIGDNRPVNRFFLNVMSARLPHEANEAECIANARLIAAAPELLEALQMAKHIVANEGTDEQMAQVFTAIEKATGSAA